MGGCPRGGFGKHGGGGLHGPGFGPGRWNPIVGHGFSPALWRKRMVHMRMCRRLGRLRANCIRLKMRRQGMRRRMEVSIGHIRSY